MQPETIETVTSQSTDALSVTNFFEKIKSAPIDWKITAVCFGLGFLTSFLFKRFFKMFVLCVVGGVGFIWLLDHFFHIINWDTVNGLLDEIGSKNFDIWYESIATWISYNIIPSIAAGIGFLIGLFF